MDSAVQKNLIPLEWTASILAALTIPLFAYAKLPIWATFVTWGAAFLVAPNLAGIKKMWPALAVGSIFGVLFFVVAFTVDPIAGAHAVLANCLIVFFVALIIMYLARIPALALAPAMFFGFACYVGVALGAGANSIPALIGPWIYAITALFLGPVLAWLSVALTFSRQAG